MGFLVEMMDYNLDNNTQYGLQNDPIICIAHNKDLVLIRK
jgi:hypothetical protein